MAVRMDGVFSGTTAKSDITGLLPAVGAGSACTLMTWCKLSDANNSKACWPIGIGNPAVTNNVFGFKFDNTTGNLLGQANLNGDGLSPAIDEAVVADVWIFLCIVKELGAGPGQLMHHYFMIGEDGELMVADTGFVDEKQFADTLNSLQYSFPSSFADISMIDGVCTNTKAWNAVLDEEEILLEASYINPQRTADLVGHWRDGEINEVEDGWPNFTLAGGSTVEENEPDLEDDPPPIGPLEESTTEDGMATLLQRVTPYPVTPLYAKATVNAAATGELVAAVSGKRIRVLSYTMTISAAGTATFKSAATAISGVMAVATVLGSGYVPEGVFETVAGEALNLTAATGNINIHITYITLA